MEEKARENISRVLGLVALDLDVSTHCSIGLAIISFCICRSTSMALWDNFHPEIGKLWVLSLIHISEPTRPY